MAQATPVGTNSLNSLTRRSIVSDQITDQVYQSNALLYRWRASGRTVSGGTHLEGVVNAAAFDAGGWYDGFDIIEPVPQDTFKNFAFGWNHLSVPVTVDGPTLSKNDSPDAIAGLVNAQLEVATLQAEDLVGTALFSTGADVNQPEGLRAAVDNGSVAATYGGLGSRTTTNDFWQPASGALDTSTAVLSLASMQTVFGAAREGGRHPSILITTDANYNRFQNLLTSQQRFPVGTGGTDEQLASAGFTNLLYNNVPLIVDSHCPANHIFFLNEDFFKFVTHPKFNFVVGDWQEAINQDAFVAKLIVRCSLVCDNVQRQGLMNAVAA